MNSLIIAWQLDYFWIMQGIREELWVEDAVYSSNKIFLLNVGINEVLINRASPFHSLWHINRVAHLHHWVPLLLVVTLALAEYDVELEVVIIVADVEEKEAVELACITATTYTPLILDLRTPFLHQGTSRQLPFTRSAPSCAGNLPLAEILLVAYLSPAFGSSQISFPTRSFLPLLL